MLKLSLSCVNEVFKAISDDKTLYLPIEMDGCLQFNKWAAGNNVRLDRINTVKSPKDFFFPQTEHLAAFKTKGKEIMINDDRDPVEPFVIFGVRACDAYSLTLLDRVFLSDPVDTFYEQRRRNGILITMACFEPEETCFCGVFDIDARVPGGDVTTYIINDTLYWESRTDKGDELTNKVKSLFTEANQQDEAYLSEKHANAKNIFNNLPLNNIKLKRFTKESIMDMFNSPKWEDLYKSCIACGTCTFICPTCHCYDIQDYDTGRGIKRFRCWDSCMYSDFTLMAHGNPRQSQLERFRQRYMHKLMYFPDNNEGLPACSGCGRCIQKCPISMNIIKVIKALGVDENV